MILNFLNAEEKVFSKPEFFRAVPELSHHYHQWRAAKMMPSLRSVAKRAVIDFVNSLNGQQLEVLEKFLGEPVVVEPFEPSSVVNVSADKEFIEKELSQITRFPGMAVTRKGDQVSITLWR